VIDLLGLVIALPSDLRSSRICSELKVALPVQRLPQDGLESAAHVPNLIWVGKIARYLFPGQTFLACRLKRHVFVHQISIMQIYHRCTYTSSTRSWNSRDSITRYCVSDIWPFRISIFVPLQRARKKLRETTRWR
jgi:hypothetical protein